MPTTSGSSIPLRSAFVARLFQLVYPTIRWLFFSSPDVEFASKPIAAPQTIRIPTRHGDIKALLYSPLRLRNEDGALPPIHFICHGGAFIIQEPDDEGNVARFLASELGVYVVVPDYTAAPQVRFPHAEEELLDAWQWVTSPSGSEIGGWDPRKATAGGPSAGTKFALTLALDAFEASIQMPLALILEYGCCDVSRSDSLRTSKKANPVVSPSLMALVRNTYFYDTDLSDPRVSPLLHPELGHLPPTLIITAELDTLRQECEELADRMSACGVSVSYHEIKGVDHGFTHSEPKASREALELSRTHLSKVYRA